MEHCVHKYLYDFVITNHILTPFQSGFVQGDSTTYQLIHTYHAFCESVDNGKEVRTVFCDISKAFDRVWHRGLLHKLSGTGCSDKIIRWFQVIFRVGSNVSFSMDKPLIGPPFRQEYLRGPLLGPFYSLYTYNDIVSDIGCQIRLFADNTSLYIVVGSPPTAANFLNSGLCAITKSANNRLVTFNASKTVSMTISRKTNSPHLALKQAKVNPKSLFEQSCSTPVTNATYENSRQSIHWFE